MRTDHTTSDHGAPRRATDVLNQATRAGRCDLHGDFVDRFRPAFGPLPAAWEGCPKCAQIERDRVEREQELARADEWRRDQVESFLASASIPLRFQGKGFDDFDTTPRGSAQALAKVLEFTAAVSEPDHGGRSMMLCGRVGNGKTHLACAAVEAVIRATAKPCKYLAFSEIVRAVKESFGRESKVTEAEIYQRLARYRLLVIDEVGMQNATEFERQVAYEVINARYLQMLPTMVISNLKPPGVAECLGDRVVDRLRENGGKAVVFDWDSYRKAG